MSTTGSHDHRRWGNHTGQPQTTIASLPVLETLNVSGTYVSAVRLPMESGTVPPKPEPNPWKRSDFSRVRAPMPEGIVIDPRVTRVI